MQAIWDGIREGMGAVLAFFYAIVPNAGFAIIMLTVVVRLILFPLTAKQAKSMIAMQRAQPEIKKLQAKYKNDRQKLNEEMMKLYQEHKVNPLASCLPLLIQMPVFFIMYRVLHGLSRTVTCVANTTNAACAGITPGARVFDPDHISKSSQLWKDLKGKQEMLAFGLDLSKSPAHFISGDIGKGLIYATLVVILGLLYFAQQKMVASRAAVSPTMSATQAKLMQYLPVVFAVFQIFFLTGLVIYYITQAIFRIGQNFYITKKFYGHEHSLGRQAQAAGERARAEAAKDKGGEPPKGMFAQAKLDAQARREALEQKKSGGGTSSTRSTNSRTNGRPAGGARPTPAEKPAQGQRSNGKKPPAKNTTPEQPAPAVEPVVSKRVTPPKNRPTPTSSRPQRPSASGRPGPPARPKPPKK